MADVTISSLPIGTPSGNALLPYSTGASTLGVPVSAIFQNASNIGINTNTPYWPLTVNGQALVGKATGAVGIDSISNIPTIFGWSGLSNVNAHLPLSIRSTPGIQLYLNTDGNVGIGTTTPTAKLEVSGDVKASNTPKAWVSFDATRQANGSPVTGNQNLYIRSSYNVTNVFRIGSGQYQVYFTNPISGDYCVTGTSEHYRGVNAAIVFIDRVPQGTGVGPIQTTYCTINTLSYTGAAYDSAAYVSVVVYGA